MGIGDAWGTREELLHPRDSRGRFRKKWKMPTGVIERISGFLAGFAPRTFGSDEEAANYAQGRGQMMSRGENRDPAVRSFVRNYHGIQDKLQSGETPPETKQIDAAFQPSDQDLIMSRVVGPEAFGLTPQNIAMIEEYSGNLVADRGYSAVQLGTPVRRQGAITMTYAVPKGTPVLFPWKSPSQAGREVFLGRDQPIRITKVDPDGQGGFNVLAVVEDPADVDMKPGEIGARVPTETEADEIDVMPKTPPGVQQVPAAPVTTPTAPGQMPAPRTEPVQSEAVGGPASPTQPNEPTKPNMPDDVSKEGVDQQSAPSAPTAPAKKAAPTGKTAPEKKAATPKAATPKKVVPEKKATTPAKKAAAPPKKSLTDTERGPQGRALRRPSDDDIRAMKVAELKEAAARHGIRIPARLRKAEAAEELIRQLNETAGPRPGSAAPDARQRLQAQSTPSTPTPDTRVQSVLRGFDSRDQAEQAVSRMTIAQLRQTAEENNVQIPRGARLKADVRNALLDGLFPAPTAFKGEGETPTPEPESIPVEISPEIMAGLDRVSLPNLKQGFRDQGFDVPDDLKSKNAVLAHIAKEVARRELTRRSTAQKRAVKKAAEALRPVQSSVDLEELTRDLDAELLTAAPGVLDEVRIGLMDPKKTPAQVGRDLAQAASRIRASAAVRFRDEDKTAQDRQFAIADELDKLADRLKTSRRKPAKKATPAPAPSAPEQGGPEGSQRLNSEDKATRAAIGALLTRAPKEAGPTLLSDVQSDVLRQIASWFELDVPANAADDDLRAAIGRDVVGSRRGPGKENIPLPWVRKATKKAVPAEPVEPVESAPQDSARPSLETSEDRQQLVIDTVREMAREPGDWVQFRELRPALAAKGLTDREQQDEAFRALDRHPKVNVVPVANAKALTKGDRDAAMMLGNEAQNAIAVREGAQPWTPETAGFIQAERAAETRAGFNSRRIAGSPVTRDTRDLYDHVDVLVPQNGLSEAIDATKRAISRMRRNRLTNEDLLTRRDQDPEELERTRRVEIAAMQNLLEELQDRQKAAKKAAAPTKKATPAKKAVPAKQVEPVKKAVPAKKAVPTKQAAPTPEPPAPVVESTPEPTLPATPTGTTGARVVARVPGTPNGKIQTRDRPNADEPIQLINNGNDQGAVHMDSALGDLWANLYMDDRPSNSFLNELAAIAQSINYTNPSDNLDGVIDKLRQLKTRAPDSAVADRIQETLDQLESPPVAAPSVSAGAPRVLQDYVDGLAAISTARKVGKVGRNTRLQRSLLDRFMDIIRKIDSGGYTDWRDAETDLRDMRRPVHESFDGGFEIWRLGDKFLDSASPNWRQIRRWIGETIQAQQKAGGADPKVSRPTSTDTLSRIRRALDSGTVTARRDLSNGIAEVHLRTYDDGTQIVHKRIAGLDELEPELRGFQLLAENAYPDQKHQVDAETLVSLVAEAIGLRAPVVVRSSDNTVDMEFMEGVPPAEARQLGRTDIPSVFPDFYLAKHHPDGPLIGLLDLLVDNRDRNKNNYLISSDDRIVPIDHTFSFEDQDAWDPEPGGKKFPAGSGFITPFFNSTGDDWKTIPFSERDFNRLRQRLMLLRPQFEALGRESWFNLMMRRLDFLAARPGRKKDRIT